MKFGKFVENINENYVQIKNCWIGFVGKTLYEWYSLIRFCSKKSFDRNGQ